MPLPGEANGPVWIVKTVYFCEQSGMESRTEKRPIAPTLAPALLSEKEELLTSDRGPCTTRHGLKRAPLPARRQVCPLSFHLNKKAYLCKKITRSLTVLITEN